MAEKSRLTALRSRPQPTRFGVFLRHIVFCLIVTSSVPSCLPDYGTDCNRNVDLTCFWKDKGICGDGAVDGNEKCDDGNNVDCDGCRSDCSAKETGCGDGFVCGTELCDDGNSSPNDGCFECASECAVENLVPPDAAMKNTLVYTNFETLDCYVHVLNPRKAWTAAESACVAWGGKLVEFGSREEQEATSKALPATSNAWTSGRDLTGTGNLVWGSNTPVSPELAWAEGEPDSPMGQCVQLTKEGLLSDEDCSALNSYSCERDMDSLE